MSPKRRNVDGVRFGLLVVLRDEEDIVSLNNNRSRAVLVRCDCGQEKKVRLGDLRKGHTTSCGCLMVEKVKEANTLYGKTKTPEYKSWVSMIRRCTDPTLHNYHRYGGRGISVCDRWLGSFELFLEDVGVRPTLKHSIDRIDNDGNYEPGNVKWSTNKEQARNSTTARMITFQGQTMCLQDWADHLGIKRTTLGMRLRSYKWSVHKAFTTPVR